MRRWKQFDHWSRCKAGAKVQDEAQRGEREPEHGRWVSQSMLRYLDLILKAAIGATGGVRTRGELVRMSIHHSEEDGFSARAGIQAHDSLILCLASSFLKSPPPAVKLVSSRKERDLHTGRSSHAPSLRC